MRNKIHTEKELMGFRDSLDERVHALNKERWYLRRELQKNPTAEERRVIEQKIARISSQLKPLYHDRDLCKDIAERSGSVAAAVNREKENAVRSTGRERGDEISIQQQRQ